MLLTGLKKKLLRVGQIILVALAAFFSTFGLYELVFSGRIYPGIYAGQVLIGGKTPQAAEELLLEKVALPSSINLSAASQSFSLNTTSVGLAYLYSETAKDAYLTDRTGDIFQDLKQRVLAPARAVNIPLKYKLDEPALDKFLAGIAAQVSTDAIHPSVQITNNKAIVQPGEDGKELDSMGAKKEILTSLSLGNFQTIQLPVTTADTKLTSQQASALEERATKLINRSLIIKYEEKEFKLNTTDLLNILNPYQAGSYESAEIETQVKKIATALDSEPQNPVFVFKDNRVQEFTPARPGVKVNQTQLVQEIINSLRSLESGDENNLTLNIPVSLTPSQYQTGDVNNLGIKELIGRGSSRFAGSISSRMFNISLAASKLNGILVAPGEVLSFNQAVGDVSSLTGYKQAYIIQDGKTILGDGGGVCQVSTTLFRAALNAGLPVIERRAHAYRVGYYEQDSPPGLDATVYSPTTDLKIKNDTANHILIQTTYNPKATSLIFEIYGTKDGRVATTTKPNITDVVPPPEDLYTDDPTLPAGTIKQIDWKAWGAKVTFSYHVERNGEEIYKKTFISNYRPWQAVFLRGTGV